MTQTLLKITTYNILKNDDLVDKAMTPGAIPSCLYNSIYRHLLLKKYVKIKVEKNREEQRTIFHMELKNILCRQISCYQLHTRIAAWRLHRGIESKWSGWYYSVPS